VERRGKSKGDEREGLGRGKFGIGDGAEPPTDFFLATGL